MRIILVLPLLMLAACNVERDAANDSTTLEFNQERIDEVGADIANTAEEVAEGAGNVVSATGAAIGNEVGDGDKDAAESRNESANAQ